MQGDVPALVEGVERGHGIAVEMRHEAEDAVVHAAADGNGSGVAARLDAPDQRRDEIAAHRQSDWCVHVGKKKRGVRRAHAGNTGRRWRPGAAGWEAGGVEAGGGSRRERRGPGVRNGARREKEESLPEGRRTVVRVRWARHAETMRAPWSPGKAGMSPGRGTV
ncbi:hypothetical protein Aave_1087 [Paracidovorax citrulli AAC00-1]|uniref:Uncharacterized protein n=1 Tax=Paracidovorax citrulli (strain AAC00-1) TaxID=397945 RepID=A1TL45_PARC0|nr:hypothetical protein Aave_1087 [Paracidovorax citrulli AAC00-1]